MPWDPKPVQQAPALAANTSNGLPSSSYANYDTPPSNATNGARIKSEPGADPQYNGLPNGYPQGAQAPPSQGGMARAQQLVQQQYGAAASASLNAMQRGGAGGLALPGQQQQVKPQGLQLPGQGVQQQHPQYTPQQQQAMRQQQQLQQQQSQPRIKVENESPQLAQGAFTQQQAPPNYSQTDGADDALEQWQAMLAERRAISAEQTQHADHMVREHVMQLSADLESGLMVPLDKQPSVKRRRRVMPANRTSPTQSQGSLPAIPQMDGDLDDEDEEKPDIKDEEDENAINSDLDDSDDDGQNPTGEDEDDGGDSILCTYDKVQRVKNKWKCTLKDGVMMVNNKEWVFHKGMGEFEW